MLAILITNNENDSHHLLAHMIKMLFNRVSKRKSDSDKGSDLRPIASKMSRSEYQEFRRFSRAWIKGKVSLWK